MDQEREQRERTEGWEKDKQKNQEEEKKERTKEWERDKSKSGSKSGSK